MDNPATNYVATLNEYVQKNRCNLQYEDLGHEGPDHNRTFSLRVVVNGKAFPNGMGTTKKEAKQCAAKNALKCLLETGQQESADLNANAADNQSIQPAQELNQNVSEISERMESLSMNNSFMEPNYMQFFNHYCQKRNISHTFIEEKRLGPSHDARFFYKLVMGNKGYPAGEGKTIKEAKQNAARLAWSALQPQEVLDNKVSVGSALPEDGAASGMQAQ